MGIALIKIKIMPDLPESNLDEIETQAKAIIEEEKGENTKTEREPIAFGLTAVIIMFSREETLSTDEMLEKLNKVETISSAEVIDFRRALG